MLLEFLASSMLPGEIKTSFCRKSGRWERQGMMRDLVCMLNTSPLGKASLRA